MDAVFLSEPCNMFIVYLILFLVCSSVLRAPFCAFSSFDSSDRMASFGFLVGTYSSCVGSCVCVCACVHACVLDILSSYCWELVFLLLLLLGWFCLPSKFSGQKQWRPSKFPLPCNIFNKYLKVVVSFCWIILDYLN